MNLKKDGKQLVELGMETAHFHCRTLPKIKCRFHQEFINPFLLTLLNLAGRKKDH